MKHTELHTIKHLSNYLRCSDEYLESILNGYTYVYDQISEVEIKYANSVTPIESVTPLKIHRFYLEKKNKSLGYRVVHKVSSDIFSSILKILNTNLSLLYTVPNCVHGFVKNKNIKTNATEHLTKKYILSVDISSFFETITYDMIVESLVNLGFKKNISEYIATLTTIDKKLVQGYNTSPTIANIVSIKMDNELISVCNNKYTYTRYADDLYFSSNDNIPEVSLIESIINRNGFNINPLKTKIMVRGSNQYVTGLTVFDSYCPRIPRRIKRRLRLELHFIKKFGIESHACKILNYSVNDFQNNPYIRDEVYNYVVSLKYRISGWIYFINSVEPKIAEKFKTEFEDYIDI